ncbi:MAG: hypothetical protein CR984_05300 [Proteobacteria bacterium]|nr:MAG: hypothetical protein CR984_05300 [Pseudomonadota bacterium]PIE67712.1 MAG: hypothetical protein CSA23_02745 [Deltaproteobacteria bacterium]
MHLSSLDKMKSFRQRYLADREEQPLKIVDLGSVSIGGNYRQFFDVPQWSYTGVDIVEGDNVDLVLSDPYSWIEIPTGSVDVFISGQAFEHIAFFWRTMQEIQRILKPGGLCCIIAPSGGPEHRYPIDCWRFYPDGFRALARYVDFDVLDVYTDWEPDAYADDSRQWADTVLVARKPEPSDDRESVSAPPHVYERTIDVDGDDSLAKIIRHIPAGSEVLELGPATGYLTRYMREQLECQIDAVEISPEMARKAEAYCRKMVVADIDAVNLADLFHGQTYDRIVIADVLEHLNNHRAVLVGCRELLGENGRLLVSIPNISHAAIIGSLLNNRFEYTDEGLLDRTHLHFFTRESIVRLLNQSGFGIDHIETIQRLPEDTEIADSLTGFSPEVQRTIFSRDDALTYQFVIACSPSAKEPGSMAETAGDSVRRVVDLRRKFIQQQNDLIGALNEKTDHLERIALERSEQIRELSETNQSMNASYSQLEGFYRKTEKMAIDRLQTINDHQDELAVYRQALKEAQQLAFSRLDSIQQLTRQLKSALLKNQALSNSNEQFKVELRQIEVELQQIKQSRWFQLGHGLASMKERLLNS